MTKYIVIVCMGLLACKENKPEVKTAPAQSEISSASEETSTLNASSNSVDATFTNESLGNLYADYLSLKESLVHTDEESAQNALRTLSQSAGTLVDGATIVAEIEKLGANPEIASMRGAFKSLSSQIEQLLAPAIEQGTIYKQYCPMAFDGAGGSWLSNSKEIRNPYYGDKMLNCGVVENELN